MRDWVRLYLDLDEEDLPDSIIDEFVEEGTQIILERESDWPFVQERVDFNPTIGETEYDLTVIAPTLQDVIGVANYEWIYYPEGAQREAGELGVGYHRWSVYGTQLHIFPAPTSTDVIEIVGFRKIGGWTSGGPGATCPLPVEFQQLVLKWALAATYAHQDDPELSQFHQGAFLGRLDALWRRYMTGNRGQRLIVGSEREPDPVGFRWPEGF